MCKHVFMNLLGHYLDLLEKHNLKREHIDCLYSSFFGLKDSNPEAFTQRITIWQQVLVDCVRRGRLGPSLFELPSVDIVAHQFIDKGNMPLGLKEVYVTKCCSH